MLKTLAKIGKYLGKNLKLGLIWTWIAICAFIAMPQFSIWGTQYNGISLSTITNGRINYDFKFSPSLDFYGGTEVVYSLGSSSSELAFSSTRLQRAAERLSTRLKNSGINDFSIYARKGQTGDELVVRLPITIDKLENFNLILGSAGPVSFIKQSTNQQLPELDPENPEIMMNQQPQIQTLQIDRGYISNVQLVFGADTYGYGIAIDFVEEKASEVVVTSFSDINTDPSNQVLLNIGERTVAGQSVPVSSNSRSAKMVMTTGLGNDETAAKLIRDMILNPSLNDQLGLVSMTQIEGRYDKISDILKVFSVFALALYCAWLIGKRKGLGLVVVINILFMVLTLIAVLKVFNSPISLIAIVGSILGLGINLISIKASLENLGQSNPEILKKRKTTSASYLRFNLFVVATSAVFGLAGIHALNQVITSFGIATFIGYITLLICLPITTSLVKSSK